MVNTRGEKSFRYQMIMNIIGDVFGGFQVQKVAEAIYNIEKPTLENIIHYFKIRSKNGSLSSAKKLASKGLWAGIHRSSYTQVYLNEDQVRRCICDLYFHGFLDIRIYTAQSKDKDKPNLANGMNALFGEDTNNSNSSSSSSSSEPIQHEGPPLYLYFIDEASVLNRLFDHKLLTYALKRFGREGRKIIGCILTRGMLEREKIIEHCVQELITENNSNNNSNNNSVLDDVVEDDDHMSNRDQVEQSFNKLIASKILLCVRKKDRDDYLTHAFGQPTRGDYRRRQKQWLLIQPDPALSSDEEVDLDPSVPHEDDRAGYYSDGEMNSSAAIKRKKDLETWKRKRNNRVKERKSTLSSSKRKKSKVSEVDEHAADGIQAGGANEAIGINALGGSDDSDHDGPALGRWPTAQQALKSSLQLMGADSERNAILASITGLEVSLGQPRTSKKVIIKKNGKIIKKSKKSSQTASVFADLKARAELKMQSTPQLNNSPDCDMYHVDSVWSIQWSLMLELWRAEAIASKVNHYFKNMKDVREENKDKKHTDAIADPNSNTDPETAASSSSSDTNPLGFYVSDSKLAADKIAQVVYAMLAGSAKVGSLQNPRCELILKSETSSSGSASSSSTNSSNVSSSSSINGTAGATSIETGLRPAVCLGNSEYYVSAPMTTTMIGNALKESKVEPTSFTQGSRLPKAYIDSILDELSASDLQLIESIEYENDKGDQTTAHCITLRKLLVKIRKSAVRETAKKRFESRSLIGHIEIGDEGQGQMGKILGILMERPYIEADTFHNQAVMSARGCRKCLHDLQVAGWIEFVDISKRSDFNPAATYYMYHLDLPKLLDRLKDEHYHTIFNLRLQVVKLVEKCSRTGIDSGRSSNNNNTNGYTNVDDATSFSHTSHAHSLPTIMLGEDVLKRVDVLQQYIDGVLVDLLLLDDSL